MFERFSGGARQALFWARYAVYDIGGGSLEPEHLLLGLLRTRGAVSQRLLTAAGLDHDAMRERIRVPGTPRHPQSTELPFGASCKELLTAAVSEADQMSSAELTTGHLLLGLLREEKSMASRILREAGVHLVDVRKEVEVAVGAGPERGDPDPGSFFGGCAPQV